MSDAAWMFIALCAFMAVVAVCVTVGTVKRLSYEECDCGCDDLAEALRAAPTGKAEQG